MRALLLAAVLLAPISAQADPPPLCGDVNLDGVVDMIDVYAIARGEVQSETLEAALCDVSQDNICNVVDALMIARGEVKAKRCGKVRVP